MQKLQGQLRIRIHVAWSSHAFHSLLCSVTKLSLPIMQDAVEECRKLCGGHGYYLNISGLHELLAIYVPACTYGQRRFGFRRSM